MTLGASREQYLAQRAPDFRRLTIGTLELYKLTIRSTSSGDVKHHQTADETPCTTPRR